MHYSSLLLRASLLIGLASPVLANYPIDDFTAGAVDLYGASGSTLTTAPGILGGERLTSFQLIAGGGYNPSVNLSPDWAFEGFTGYICYSSGFGNRSVWSLTYGANAELDFNATWCGADRLILGGAFQFDTDASGGPNGPYGVDGTPCTVTLWSNGLPASVNRLLYSNPAYSSGQYMVEFEFLFSDFPGIDFSSLDRIKVEFQQATGNPAVDYCLHGIYLNCDEGFEVGAIEQPTDFALAQNVPNPFNPSTTISFSVEETAHATLTVFDLSGRQVATLVNGLVDRGAHKVDFDSAALPSGVYFYTLQADGRSLTQKMLLVK